MEKFWLPLIILVITLLIAFFGIVKEILPSKLYRSWPMYIMVLMMGVGALLQFYQGYRGLYAQNKTSELAADIEPGADKKPLTPNEQQIYAELGNIAKQFREAPVKLFVTPSVGVDTLYKLALIQFNQRNYADAEMNLRYALELDSEHKDSYNLLLQLYQTEAMHFLHKGDYKSAGERLKSASYLLEKKPQGIDDKTVVLIGYLYKTLGQVNARSDVGRAKRYWKDAEQAFKFALLLNEKNPDAINGLGNILQFQGEYLKALEKHKEALRLAPNYTAAANDAGLASRALMCQSLAQQKDNEADKWRREAISFWERAIQLSQTDPGFESSYASSMSYHVNRLREDRISDICK